MKLLLMLGRLTESNRACREAFRLSPLGQRDKARADDRYLNLTLRKVRAILADQAFHVAEGSRIMEGLFWPEPNPLDALRVDWESEDDVEVPDIVAGLLADEEVTLLGGHGGIGKGFLAFQIAGAVATGTRKVGVLLIVHIDRSSARGNTTNDDGYAGSAQWHNSCRRRLFLQQEVKREKDEFTDEFVTTVGGVKLRVMKNQDGPPDPDTVLSRGSDGFWQVGAADISALLPAVEQLNHGPALLALIASYYQRGIFMSTSLAPQATSGVFATLKGDPDFPKGLTKKGTDALLRQLERDGALAYEHYRRPNRSFAERWVVVQPPMAGG